MTTTGSGDPGPDAALGRGLHLAIAISTSDEESGRGDLYVGRELGAALVGLGCTVSFVERRGGGWYHPDPSVDAILAMTDDFDVTKIDRQVATMAWIRNWPEHWVRRTSFTRYDHVFASSRRTVEMVHAGTGREATLLPLAVNPARFADAAADPRYACDVLFVGNYWSDDRAVIRALPSLARSGRDVRVYGVGWERVPQMRSLHAGFIRYEDLPGAYASAAVVVDDAARSTIACGSVNSRVFDAVATGATVASNAVDGVRDLLGSRFPVWTDGPSLEAVVDRVLTEPEVAAAEAAVLRDQVLRHHRYEDRARIIVEVATGAVEELERRGPVGVDPTRAPRRSRSRRVARTLVPRRLRTAIRGTPRGRQARRPGGAKGLDRVQVGCGPRTILRDWWNVDIRTFPGVDEVLDVTSPWPWDDLRYVFGEHFIEHLTLDEAASFLANAARAIGPGGRMRLATPSLESLTRDVVDPDRRDTDDIARTFAMNRSFYGWGHRFIYSRPMLEHILSANGFTDITFHDYGESDDPNLRMLEQHGGYTTHRGVPNVWIVEATPGGDATTTMFLEEADFEVERHRRSGH